MQRAVKSKEDRDVPDTAIKRRRRAPSPLLQEQQQQPSGWLERRDLVYLESVRVCLCVCVGLCAVRATRLTTADRGRCLSVTCGPGAATRTRKGECLPLGPAGRLLPAAGLAVAGRSSPVSSRGESRPRLEWTDSDPCCWMGDAGRLGVGATRASPAWLGGG